MKYLLDVTLLASSGACHFAHGPPPLGAFPVSSHLRRMEEKAVLCPSLLLPVTFVLMTEPPPVPVTEQGLYLRHLISLLQLPCEVGSMVMSLSQGRKPT